MKTLDLVQGSKKWLAVKSMHFSASEAPAMMGESKYMTRDELLAQKKTGITPDIDVHTQRIFDNGHKFEALARPWANEIIGDELFSATGSEVVEGIPLLASFDGITMDEEITWEHKSLNDVLRDCLNNKKTLPLMYRIQMEEQLMVSKAKKCLFMASNGKKEDMLHCWYKPNKSLQKKIIAGWKQFKKDMEGFTPAEPEKIIKTKTIQDLPALIVNVSGAISNTNIVEFQDKALVFIENINTTLETDNDFANAEQMVKFCDKAEKQIKAVKQVAVDQMADVSTVFRSMDFIVSELSKTRLMLDKLVKTEKVRKKNSIVNEASDNFNAYVTEINAGFEANYINYFPNSFDAVIKGKKTIASVQSAVNDELARLKIEVDALAATILTNTTTLNVYADEYRFLFNDLASIINKAPDDFDLLVKSRVSEHVQAEKEREEKAAAEALAIAQDDSDPVNMEDTSTTSYHDATPAVQAKINDDKSVIAKAKECTLNAIKSILIEGDGTNASDSALAVLNAIQSGKIPNVKYSIY